MASLHSSIACGPHKSMSWGYAMRARHGGAWGYGMRLLRGACHDKSTKGGLALGGGDGRTTKAYHESDGLAPQEQKNLSCHARAQ